ncbi:MAG: sulfotransferase family 2 domain-containing protein [Cyanobacteria bacterium J06642_9]
MGYVKRIIKNILIDGKPNIFFMHIPKTGGTSIDFAISRHYPIGKYYVDPSATVKVAEMMAGQSFDMVNFEACFELRENLLAYKMAKGTKYVTGHVPFRLETWKNFHEQYIFSTVLRDPVKRYISEFLYKKYKEKEYGNIDLDFSDYLASDIGKRCASTYVR